MDRRTVLTKTAKGLMEVTGKTSLLPRDLRNVLAQVDGKATVGDLHQKLDRFSEAKLLEALGRLAKDGFVREFVSAPASISPPSQVPIVQEDVDLDFTALISKPPTKAEVTAQTKAEADDVARQVAQARAKQDADRAKREAEERAKREAAERARKEAEEKARREAEARARAEAEARAKHEAEERARREAEERARREVEERARREAEERGRREAAERARREAEERARRELEEKSRLAESRARQEAEAHARREAEGRARSEAEERARHDAEERALHEQEARIRRELEDRVRQAEEQGKREAQERAQRDADERARREAADRARREVEDRARREAEERRRREADERARREAEEERRREAAEAMLRRDAEERARREGEERARREAEEERRREAEESARRREEEERTRREADRKAREEEKARAKAEAEAAARARRDERAREKAEAEARAKAKRREREKDAAQVAARLEKIKAGRKGGLGKFLGAALVLAVVGGILYLQFFMPLDIAQYERLAASRLGQPVKIRSGTISVFPSPAVRFEGISVGRDGNVRIASAAAHPDFASVMSEQPQLKSLELEGVTLDAAGLGAVLFGRPQSAALGLERVHATGIKLAVPGVPLPELEATVSLQPDGSVQKILVNNPNKTIAAEIRPTVGRALVEMTVGGATALLGLPFQVDSLSVRGVATATEFAASELDAKLLDGVARGKGTLRWPGPLAFDASFELKQLDAKRITPFLVGRVQGTGVLTARGESLEKLASGARLNGSFAVSKGQIAGVDLPRTLQSGKSVPGSTNFNELSAQAQLDRGRLALRSVKIDAGALSASGAVEVDGSQSLTGRFAADMKTPGGTVRASVGVSGSSSQLIVSR
jgi:hypothetical protein